MIKLISVIALSICTIGCNSMSFSGKNASVSVNQYGMNANVNLNQYGINTNINTNINF